VEGIASRTPDLVTSSTPFLQRPDYGLDRLRRDVSLTVYANAMVAIEALTGLMGLAMGSGLMFARF